MKTFIIATLVALSTISFGQRLSITGKDNLSREIEVKNYNTRTLMTTLGETLMFVDMKSAILLDYDHARDNGLVVAMQAAGVSVAMGSAAPITQTTVPKSDSLRLVILETRVDQMQINVGQFHRQHQRGTVYAIAGTLLSVVGAVITHDEKGVNPLVYVGGGVALFGGIQMIDSYKYLKRAAGQK
jgi:hypothetical protein